MIIVPFDVNDARGRRNFLDSILPRAVSEITENTAPAWGNMSARHVIEHLTWTFRISSGQYAVPCNLPPRIVERARRYLYDEKMASRNFKNPLLGEHPPGFVTHDFSVAQSDFLRELKIYFAYFKQNPDAIPVHPVFGPIGAEEWDRSHYKHCYHHLYQLGAIAPPPPPVSGGRQMV